MIEGRDIICFSNDWNGDPLSKKHIMRRLARNNRVLWINSLGNRRPQASVYDLKRAIDKLLQFFRGSRPVEERIHVLSPLVLPFFGSSFARILNRRLLSWTIRRACRNLGFHKPITWTFLPTSADVVGTLGESMIVYQCVDEYSEFSGTDKTAILEMERRLIKMADCIIVSSDQLLKTKRSARHRSFLVTHGVEVAHFGKAYQPETPIPDDIAALPRPIVGFFGLIADWVDLDLIRFVARSHPACSFVLVGDVRTDSSILAGLPNVHLLGRRPYHLLPSYCKAFDIAMLPFVINELTVAANPLKLREYLAAGLPVISTALPEAKKLGDLVHIAETPQQFAQHLTSLLNSGAVGPQRFRSLRMESESWDAKVREMSNLVLKVEKGRLALRAAAGG